METWIVIATAGIAMLVIITAAVIRRDRKIAPAPRRRGGWSGGGHDGGMHYSGGDYGGSGDCGGGDGGGGGGGD